MQSIKIRIHGEGQMAQFKRSAAAAAIAAAMFSNAALAQSATQDQPSEKQDAAAGKQDSPPEKAADAKQQTKGTAASDDAIVVTAQKIGAQSLQKVPLAIQVFSGEELKERNIETIGDLVSSVPGAQEGFRQSNGSRFYNLRGNVTQNGDSPIGYYLDDTPFIVTNFGIAPPVRFLDMERVEVLRGPQGTLYGQGSSGGVFIFHTRDPNLDEIEYAFEAEG